MARPKSDKEKYLIALLPEIHKKLRITAAEYECYTGDVITSLTKLIDPLRSRVKNAIEAGLIPGNYGSHFFEVAELVLLMDSGSITPQDCYLRAAEFDSEKGGQGQSVPKEAAAAEKFLADLNASTSARMETLSKALNEMVGDGMDIFDKLMMDMPELREELDRIDTGRHKADDKK
jgi:hypothetical protein